MTVSVYVLFIIALIGFDVGVIFTLTVMLLTERKQYDRRRTERTINSYSMDS